MHLEIIGTTYHSTIFDSGIHQFVITPLYLYSYQCRNNICGLAAGGGCDQFEVHLMVIE